MLGWILIFTIVGGIFGIFLPTFSNEYMGLLSSSIFLPMVKSIIVPLVFSTLVIGIAGHEDMVSLGRLAAKSMLYFISMTFVAIFVGLLMGNVVKPGVGVDLSMADEDTGLAKPHFGLKSEIEKIIPESFYKAASNNETLQVVFCACMFAVGILLCPSKKAAKSMLEFCHGLSLVMFKVTELIMNFVPIAIAGAIAQTIAKNGIGVLANLGKLIACVYGGLSIFLVILTGVILLTRTNIISFLKTIWEPMMIAFATSSSEAAMPLAMEKMVQFGVPSEIVAFVIPTGYTFNLDGTTLYLGTASIFAMQAGNVDKTISEQIQMMAMLMLMAKGVAAVPRASLVVLAAGCEQFGLPSAAVAVILGVDAILDMARTSVNLLGNCVACVVVAKWEGKLVAGGIKINEQVAIADVDEKSATIDLEKAAH